MLTQQIQLTARPDGFPKPTDFRLVEVELPALGPGEMLVENLWMSVDPYMRRCMQEATLDQQPWPLNGPLNGPAIGRVIESKNEDFKCGDLVESLSGWQRHFATDGGLLVPFESPFNSVVKRSLQGVSPRDYLGLLGLASLTAYTGIVLGNTCQAGETVVISSGAGTVGSVACQIAQIRGLCVVSSAGSDEKVRWLTDAFGLDRVFNYRKQPIELALASLCPEGIDLVLENAGPEHLSACLPLMNELKTVLISGLISTYSTGGKIRSFPNFEFVLDRFLTIRAYRYMDFLQSYDVMVNDLLHWRDEGRLLFKEVPYEGLEAAPQAFCSMLRGESYGKPLIQISVD
jgi:NADPH-dependent curcumin reductase CurA